MTGRRLIRRVVDLQIVEAAWWEKVVLFFCPMQVVENELVKIHYKIFFDAMYIYRRDDKRKRGCLARPFDGGILAPWLN